MRNKTLTIVIKLGTSSIVDEKTYEPRLSTLSVIVETALKLRRDGHRVVIVSSGAIGVGLRRMNVDKRPKHLPMVQALAAVGQCRLMSLFDSLFTHLQQPVAQILLTRNDIADRTQYINAQNTFAELLNMGVIPIVNENDTLAVTEIKFGDNDTLSAITAGMIQADYLFLMTDVDCLYTSNPRLDPTARPIAVVEDVSSLQVDVSTAGSALGTGGMSTKLVAARLATSAGVTTVITRSSLPGNIAQIVAHDQLIKTAPTSSPPSTVPVPPPSSTPPSPPLHTRFLPSPHPIRDRSFWLLHGLAPHGTLYIDAGAARALAAKAGLFPVGVVGVEGSFAQQEAVRLCVVARPVHPHDNDNNAAAAHAHPEREVGAEAAVVAVGAGSADGDGGVESGGEEIGRALVNYSAVEIARVKGLQSTEIRDVLGYADSEYVALRENVSLFGAAGSGVGAGGSKT